MSVAEIEKTKTELKNWIEKLSDNQILHTLESIKATEEAKEETWDSLPEAHKRNILKGV